MPNLCIESSYCVCIYIYIYSVSVKNSPLPLFLASSDRQCYEPDRNYLPRQFRKNYKHEFINKAQIKLTDSLTVNRFENDWNLDSIVDGLMKYVMFKHESEPLQWKFYLTKFRHVEYSVGFRSERRSQRRFRPWSNRKTPLVGRSNLLDVGYHPDFTLKVEPLKNQKIKVSWPVDKIDDIYLVYLSQSDGPEYAFPQTRFYSTFNTTSELPWLEINCGRESQGYKILDLSSYKLKGTYDLNFILRKGHEFTYFREYNVALIKVGLFHRVLNAHNDLPLEGKHGSSAYFMVKDDENKPQKLAIGIDYDPFSMRAKDNCKKSGWPRTQTEITRIVKLGPNSKETIFKKPLKCKTNVSNSDDLCVLPENFTIESDATYLIFYTYNIGIKSEEFVQYGISLVSTNSNASF